MRLNDLDIEAPPPRAVQQLERLSPCTSPPTKFDESHGITIVMNKPVDMRIQGVRWLLGDGFYVRRDLQSGVSIHGGFQDEASSDASTRLMMFKYLTAESGVVRVKEVVRIDQEKRWAIGTNAVRYPSDVSLEALLSLVGEGAVAYAINRFDGFICYRVDGENGVAAVSTWTQVWQDWWQRKAREW